MASPLREQLRERVQESQKRRGHDVLTDAAGPAEVIDYEVLKRREEECDPPAAGTTIAGRAILPRLASLEDFRPAIVSRVDDLSNQQVTTDHRLATAIAKLAALVGVNPADLGL